ncbi:MAG TPA: Gfo/Idh/MocA family oxidoreductase [Bryobacteraceae bacterium]|nr:Gfo/Idh/MocA family oxidoreductase [Bryobacteraceae bacterium]
MPSPLNVGLIGLGRLGSVYAQNFAHRVPNARLVAAADPKPELRDRFAAELPGISVYANHEDLLRDADVDAVAVVSSTSTHRQVVLDAAASKKAIFCEKPLSLSLAGAYEMAQAVQAAGVFFQAAFQRRFDAAYVAAKRKVEDGVIGAPLVLTSISRDPQRPPLEFCDPNVSGGIIADMGIHDFDVARMFLGEVATVQAFGGVLAYPEMRQVGDIDNALINMVFESGGLGTVQLSRNSVFGYDIRTEIWGAKGSIQIGYFRETPIVVMTQEGITHDAVPYFMQRFRTAYLTQIQDFVDNVTGGKPPSITAADAIAAMRISAAATMACRERRIVEVSEVDRDGFRKAV